MSRVINFFIMIYLISFIFASSSKKKRTGNRLWRAIRGNKYNNGKISSSPLSQQTCLAANNSDPNQQKADSLNATNSGLPTQSKKTQEHKVYMVTPSDTTKVGDNTFFLKKTDKEPTNDNEKDMSQSASLNYEQELVPYLRNRYREISGDKEKDSQESEQNNGQELVPYLRNRYREISGDKEKDNQESEQSGESTNETVDRLVTSTKQDGYRLSGRLPHPYKISFNRRVLSNRIAAFLQFIKRRKGRLPTK